MKKIFQKASAFLLVISILALSGNYAAAAADSSKVPEVSAQIFTEQSQLPVHDSERVTLNQSVSTRGKEYPTAEYDLNEASYIFYFETSSYTYLNHLFTPDSNGEFILAVNDWNSGGEEVKIEVFRRGLLAPYRVHTWTGEPTTIAGIGYSNLVPGEKYFFKISTYQADSVSGYGEIYY